ncbi:hypothetical protein, partial [Pseudomonas syringae]|uniref:hypothetical protein n=1 Tax=Pseudomonas syringae TaxID=317 RepID=UPI001F1C73F7
SITGIMTKLKSMFLLLRDRKNGRFAAAGCPVLQGAVSHPLPQLADGDHFICCGTKAHAAAFGI